MTVARCPTTDASSGSPLTSAAPIAAGLGVPGGCLDELVTRRGANIRSASSSAAPARHDRSALVTFETLVDRARALTANGSRRSVLGLVGSPGAGKSTLAEALLEALRPTPPADLPPHHWVAHVPMDGFHLADKELLRLGRMDRKGAPDTFDAAGYAALLRRIAEDEDKVVYGPA